MPKEILTEDIKEALKEGFKELKEDVKILIFTKKGTNDQFNEFAVNLTNELSKLSGKIKPEFHNLDTPEAKKYSVERSPTVLIAPDKYSIRYTGAPLGEEGRSFITAILMASTGKTLLSEDSRKRLERLRDKRHVRVFVSPT